MPIEKSKFIRMGGEMVYWGEAEVHFLTPGMQYGCAVFEGTRAYRDDGGQTNIFRLREHVDRLFDSASVLSIEIPISKKLMEEATIKTVRDNGLGDCYIRTTVWKGYGNMGLDQREAPVGIGIAAFPWDPLVSPSGIRVKISEIQKISSRAVPAVAKICGSYVNSLIAKQDAIATGFDEAILLNDRNFVAEATAQNVFVVKDKCIRTPPRHADILMGITRDTTLISGEELGFDMREENITAVDLLGSDEVFLTGTASEIAPAIDINGKKIGDGKPGPVTLQLQKSYADLVRGRNQKHTDWLTAVYL